MRKFLSLVLALVMMMSLVTINAGAKEFTDDSDITYQEAVDVISAIKVVDGYANGSFNPGGNLTRGAAAKIICNLILGPTTASELHADTAPFRDVAVTHEFAGYIAYCQKEGIISGYADGTFRPAGTLTGYAFMKMLLGALGYDAEIEGFVGPNWSINVAKKAIGIGLNRSLTDEFNGVDYITREEAALYSFNTLRTDLVEYDQKITATVNGAEVTVGNSLAKAQTWNNSITRHNNIRNDEYIQFAEQYFNKLVLTETVDAFGRPDREWRFDGDDIGAYINYDLLKQEYTTEVKGIDLYDLLGSDTVKDYKFEITIDGVDVGGKTGTTDHNAVLGKTGDGADHSGKPYFDASYMAKTFKSKIGQTGKGTLTQVFVDNDRTVEKVWVSVINTYLAKVTSDYNEKRDEAKLDVYALTSTGSGEANTVYYKWVNACDTNKGQTENLTITSEDFARAADMKKDDIVLVRVANGEVKEILDPEILSEVSMSKFSKSSYVVSEGTQYDYDTTVDYDPDTLDLYTGEGSNAVQQLKDTNYNIYLDPYGYLIGVEIVDAQKNYVLLTGIDQGTSNLNNKTADAAGILTDGTFVNFRMNMSNSRQADGKTKFYGHPLWNTWCTYTVDKDGVYTLKEVGDFDDVFNPADGEKAAKAGQYTDFFSNEKTIDHKHVSLYGAAVIGNDNKPTSGSSKFVYGNDDSIYILAELKQVAAKDAVAATYPVAGDGIVDKIGNAVAVGRNVGIISGVDSIGVGINNVSIKTYDNVSAMLKSCDPVISSPAYPGWIYTLFDDEGYVIAAVVVGEDNGTNKNLVYSHKSGLESEEYNSADDTWTWTRKVIKDGEEILLTQTGDDADKENGLYGMTQNTWFEVNMKADDTVKDVKLAYYDEAGKRIGYEASRGSDGGVMTLRKGTDPDTNDATNMEGDFVDNITNLEAALNDGKNDTTTLYEQVWGDGKDAAGRNMTDTLVENNRPSLIGSTLYVDTNARRGFYVHQDVKSVLIQTNYGDTTTDYGTGTSDLEGFLKDLNFMNGSYRFKISAILTDGRASVVIIHDWNTSNATQGSNRPGSSTSHETRISGDVLYVALVDADDASDAVIRNNIARFMRGEGYTNVTTSTVNTIRDSVTHKLTGLEGFVDAYDDGVYYSFDVVLDRYWTVKVDDTVVAYVSDGANNAQYTISTSELQKAGGTGYLLDGNYVANTTAVNITDATQAHTVETGYTKTVAQASITSDNNVDGAAPTIEASNKDATVAKAANGITVTAKYAQDADNNDNKDYSVSVTVTYADGKTSTTAAQTLSHTALDNGNVTLSFKIKDLSKDITAIAINATEVKQAHKVAVATTGLTGNARNGVTFQVMECPDTAVEGSTVTVQVGISGTASGQTTFELSNGTWAPNTLTQAGIPAAAGGKITVADGSSWGTEQVLAFTFEMGAADTTVTITAADA